METTMTIYSTIRTLLSEKIEIRNGFNPATSYRTSRIDDLYDMALLYCKARRFQ